MLANVLLIAYGLLFRIYKKGHTLKDLSSPEEYNRKRRRVTSV